MENGRRIGSFANAGKSIGQFRTPHSMVRMDDR